MYKILIIDRCQFSRYGLEKWLTEGQTFSAPVMVTSLNSLFLAKEHIEHWQPSLVIADLSGFQDDPSQANFIASLFTACGERSQVILLHYRPARNFTHHDAVLVTLSKKTQLQHIKNMIESALSSRPWLNYTHTISPLLTRQEEKVLSLWLEGVSNPLIAGMLSISGKTVYTYKRNIRLKLRMDNRYSPFLSSAERIVGRTS
ncbi:helix-turn-helix transcriptional regulator [Superficieibacter electus]|uniref:Helix-turn-helix transcriptional regulator n=1 Tax=Superficieibacter electus TaxID=2022662 RepID=A0A2P5GM30_9ENTR|nr:LuxR C-terminal-related transcriptional regulator [Superficieibacter electus]POP40842.1 helix-turn-helix transcriptional regulator [Superficieibacter electus]POP46602.1 helix-turn-helix transcriptional regulator [Superficieibacter electus]